MKIGVIGTGNIGGTLARKLSAAGHDVQPSRFESLGQRFCICNDISGVELECGTQRLAEGNRLGGDHMHQRSAL